MKTTVICSVLIAFVLLCSQEAAYGQSPSDSLIIKVGCVLPLTGVWAEFGEASHNGITLAQEERPELFTHTKFLTEDSQSQNTVALSAFHKLRGAAGADLIYVWAHGHVQAIAPVAEELHYPLIGVSAEGAVTKGKSYVIRFAFSAEQLGRMLSEYFRGRGAAKFGAVIWENAFTQGIANGFSSSLRQGETFDVVENLSGAESDFKPALLKLKSRSYDAVGVLLGPKQFASFYQQAQMINLPLTTFGTHYFESGSEVVQAGPAIDGAVFAAVAVDPQFETRYLARFGEGKPTSFAANAYDFAILTAQLFNEARRRPTANEIMRAYSGGAVADGAMGSYHYTNEPDQGPCYQPPAAIKQILEGKVRVLVR